jgi:O-antigen ligase
MIDWDDHQEMLVSVFARKFPAVRADGLFLGVLIGTIVLTMGMIEYGPVWFYPIDGRNYALVQRLYGSQYRLIFWAMIMIGLLSAAYSGRMPSIGRAIAPFAPFIIVAILSCLLADNPNNATWYMAQWLTMILAATTAGSFLHYVDIRKTVLNVFIVALALSLALYLVVPSVASMPSGGRVLLRGLFVGKQAAGWFAAMACIWAVAIYGARMDPKYILTIFLGIAVLFFARSATAISILFAAIPYFIVLRTLQKTPISAVGKIFLAAIIVGGGALVVELGLSFVLGLFGKDPTLTGRSEIWELYWRFMRGTIFLGRGPGAFAFGSDINTSIAPHIEADYVLGVHSMYLEMFGETGMIGAALYVLPLIYFAIVAPFRNQSIENSICAVLALIILISGFGEARDTIVPALSSFLIFTLRSSYFERKLARASQSGLRSRKLEGPTLATGSYHVAREKRAGI